MANTPHVHPLITAIDVIDDFQQFISLPPDADADAQIIAQGINRLLERLSVKYSLSSKESDSLAAASIRMVVMADVHDRLNQADKHVKTASDLKTFFEEVVIDLKEATSAQVGLYVSLDGGGNLRNLLAPGLDVETVKLLKRNRDFHKLLVTAFTGKEVVHQSGFSGEGIPPVLASPMLVAPVIVHGKTIGIFLMLEREGEGVFSRDDLTMLDQLLPDVTRVLERIDLMRALEQSNKSLHAEQLKQQVLIEQLESAQSQLLQSEKMASVGQLAAGVAHEINNPIGFVYSNMGTLEKYLEDLFAMVDSYELAESSIADGDVLARLQLAKQKLDLKFLKEDLPALMGESKDGITRVKKIVQDLKDFSHADVEEKWDFADLEKGIDTTLNIVNNEIKYKADVVKEYGSIAEVNCLSSQLNQVFMNLLVNAAHAIEERGTITIRTGKQGEEVWVEVADTGKGIAPENIKRIFDPFFTTKPIGKGTGLGLSMAYGIIQKHHGRIEVHSEVGKGTTFRVCLPQNHQS
ncbi:ATP-binding protein [Sulfurirhabdus autotrophica]|uniref:histidine kinase n=1 Tax=Sulfurirhabdus autotrophica TaxID=1706046 RepID=A0A4R3YCS3_9PROT|nr:ATP-binding protein [Sulfurirhabdus autotrophica]TCV89651.1 phospho-acceptor domain-containing protein [Sulfurirhabdus autotrophica]